MPVIGEIVATPTIYLSLNSSFLFKDTMFQGVNCDSSIHTFVNVPLCCLSIVLQFFVSCLFVIKKLPVTDFRVDATSCQECSNVSFKYVHE